MVRESVISHPKSKKSMTFADIVKSGKATKTFTLDELKAIVGSGMEFVGQERWR